MTTYNIPHAWSVGFDSVFDRLERLNSQQPAYPPHNVVKTGDESFKIEVAVAGLSQKDLEITQDENHYMVQDTYNYFKDKIPQQSLDNIFDMAKRKVLI